MSGPEGVIPSKEKQFMQRQSFVALLAFWLASGAAFASGIYTPQTILNAATAGSNQTTQIVDTGAYPRVSFQVVWTSLTGTVDGAVKLQSSNDNTNWIDKTGATFTLSGASGSNLISLNGVVTEKYYRAVYTKNNVTGGTISVIAFAKER